MKSKHLLLLPLLLSQTAAVWGMMEEDDIQLSCKHRNVVIIARNNIDITSLPLVYRSNNKGAGFLGFNSWHTEGQSTDFTQTALRSGQIRLESSQGEINLRGGHMYSDSQALKSKRIKSENSYFRGKNIILAADSINSVGGMYVFEEMSINSEDFSSKGSLYEGVTLNINTSNLELQGNSFKTEHLSFNANELDK